MNNVGYLLGHDADELERLEEQARVLAPATDIILARSGIAAGMRVLDLGTGAGDVAMALAHKVGPIGTVVGIDQSAQALATARARCAGAGLDNVSFVESDLMTADVDGPFDAVVGRLVLLYTTDPVAVVRRYAGRVRPGGTVVAMEYEMTAAGMLPQTALGRTVVGWITEAFRRSGLDPLLGVHLAAVFRRAGLSDPATVGVQGYCEAGDPVGPRTAAAMVRTLLPVLERTGVATAADVDIDALERRLAADQAEHDAALKLPTLVGTWARVNP